MRALRFWLIALAAAAVAVVLVRFVWMRPRPVDVRVVRLESGPVEETVTSTKAGAVRSRMAADLSIEAAGLITTVPARRGASARRGDPLLTIDRRDADAAVEAAGRDLAVLQALALVELARYRDAVRERDRLEGIRATVSQSQLDQAQTLVESLSASMSAAQAKTSAQETAVARARIAADKCTLRAPFDGVVAELFVEVGEWARPGKVVMRLLDPARLYVRAELDEVDVGRVRPGLTARVTLDPYKDRKLEGTIVRVAPYVSEVEEQNRTLEVEVELADGKNLELKPGTSADVEVVLRRRDRAQRLPTSSILEGDRVLVAGPEGRAKSVALKIGLRNWEFVEVLEGLAAEDAVIVSLESEEVKEGARVRGMP